MISALWLAVSLFLQDIPINARAAAEVALVSEKAGTAESLLVPLPPATATPRNKTVRVLILSFSNSWLSMEGERSSLRLKDASPRFQVTLPAGIDADDVRLVRLKLKDGRRTVGFTHSLERPFSSEVLMPMKLEPVDPTKPNVLWLVTTSPLQAGEYAVLVDLRFFDFGVN